jgi:hypothetical protein
VAHHQITVWEPAAGGNQTFFAAVMENNVRKHWEIPANQAHSGTIRWAGQRRVKIHAPDAPTMSPPGRRTINGARINRRCGFCPDCSQKKTNSIRAFEN